MKKVLLIFAAVLIAGVLCAGAYIKFALPDVAAAPAIKAPTDKVSIEHGAYLANHVAVCMDCHSRRDWSRFSGPLAAGPLGIGGEYFGPEMGFPGKFYAANLTPAHLGNWTDGEIFRAITTGVSKDGHALFPVMPYQHYAKMDQEDVLDIIAYIRTLPAAKSEIPPADADFPMNFILNTIPDEAHLSRKPDVNDQIAYGAYLVNVASCGECHTPVNKGEPIAGKELAGGREFLLPGGALYSANLTPDKMSGIGNWTEADFLNRFRTYADPDVMKPVAQTDFNTIMPWSMYANMEDRDLKAIYAYLHSLQPIPNKVTHFVAKK